MMAESELLDEGNGCAATTIPIDREFTAEPASQSSPQAVRQTKRSLAWAAGAGDSQTLRRPIDLPPCPLRDRGSTVRSSARPPASYFSGGAVVTHPLR